MNVFRLLPLQQHKVLHLEVKLGQTAAGAVGAGPDGAPAGIAGAPAGIAGAGLRHCSRYTRSSRFQFLMILLPHHHSATHVHGLIFGGKQNIQSFAYHHQLSLH